MSEKSENEEFRTEKVEVTGDVTKDSILSESVREKTSEIPTLKLKLRE